MQTLQIPPTWPKMPTENRFESLEKSDLDNKLNEQENKSEKRTVEQQLLDVREQRSKLYKRKKLLNLNLSPRQLGKRIFRRSRQVKRKTRLLQMSKRSTANPRQRLHNLPRSLAKNDVFLVGDSMLYNIEAECLSTKRSFVRVRCFPGATLEDMDDYIRPLA